jgi:hypothetical protein
MYLEDPKYRLRYLPIIKLDGFSSSLLKCQLNNRALQLKTRDEEIISS